MKMTQKLLLLVPLLLVFIKCIFVTANEAPENRQRNTYIRLNCRNNTGFQAQGIKYLRMVQEQSCGSTNRKCYVTVDSDSVRKLILYKHYEVMDDHLHLHPSRWREQKLTLEILSRDVVVVEYFTRKIRGLPRTLEAETGTFSIQCEGQRPSTTTTVDTTTGEEQPTSLDKTTVIIIIIVAITLCIIGVFIGIAVFIVKRRQRGLRSRSPPKQNNYYTPTPDEDSDKIYKKKLPLIPETNRGKFRLPGIGNTNEQYDAEEGSVPLNNNKETAALYIDPLTQCPTYSPDHYNNKPKVTTPPPKETASVVNNGKQNQPPSSDYSYTYTEPKYRPKVMPKPAKALPKNNNKKQALLPPKTPAKPGHLKLKTPGMNRQISEGKYEDVEHPQNVLKR